MVEICGTEGHVAHHSVLSTPIMPAQTIDTLLAPVVNEYCSECGKLSSECHEDDHLIVYSERRIVLSWGEHPSDLDLHLRWNDEHIYWEHKRSRDRTADLDIDVVNGKGPETITIRQMSDYTYHVFVHNFTGGNKRDLSKNGATVRVYNSEGFECEIYAPRSETGHFWNVLDINGKSGELSITNTFTDTNVHYDDYWPPHWRRAEL